MSEDYPTVGRAKRVVVDIFVAHGQRFWMGKNITTPF